MKKQIIFIGTLLIGSIALLSMTNKESNIQNEPWEVPAKYEKMENPYAKATDDERIGKLLFTKHCKSCHGTKGKGDGKKAETLDTEVGDFTEAAFKNQSDGALYYKTFFGRDDMPSFKKKITDKEDQWLIINYIKNF